MPISIVDILCENTQSTVTFLGYSFNPKETSWGLKGPVAYISYHRVSLKNRFLLNVMYSSRILFYTILCVKEIELQQNFTDSFVKKLHKRLKRAS